jgi:hypothetical protein
VFEADDEPPDELPDEVGSTIEAGIVPSTQVKEL